MTTRMQRRRPRRPHRSRRPSPRRGGLGRGSEREVEPQPVPETPGKVAVGSQVEIQGLKSGSKRSTEAEKAKASRS